MGFGHPRYKQNLGSRDDIPVISNGLHNFDKIGNEDIRRKLNIFSLCEKIIEYCTDWKNHIQHMAPKRLPRAAFYYTPKGK